MSETIAVEPVRRSIMVDCPMEEAFRVFTTEIASWWPLLTHSIGGEQVEQLVFEERAGGELYEVAKDGARARWADVLTWEPPTRFVLDWQVNPADPATELEVRFAAEDGGTRVELEHRGWERFGERADEARGNYANGWVTVLGRFEENVGR